MRVHLIFSLVVIVLRATVLLVPAGGAIAASTAEEAVSCHASRRFSVVERERAQIVGSDFLVRSKATADESPPCAFDDAAGFRIGDPDDAYHFNALRGDHLVLENTTGASGSVVVFNLVTRRKVLDVPVGDDVAADDAGVTYWQRSADGTTLNCQEFAKYRKDGFGARIETRFRFVFATESTVPDKQTRCAPSP